MKIDYKNMTVYQASGDENLEYPVVISIPHSGRFFPPQFFDMTNLSENELRGNEDCYVDEMLSELSQKGISTLSMNVSRAFIDVNRDQIELDDHMFEDYPADKIIFENSRCRSGYGLIHRVSSNSKPIYKKLLSYQEVQDRIKNIYLVYHKKLKEMVEACSKKFGCCLLLDCHSMPSKICSIMNDGVKIDVCLGDLFLQSCPKELSDCFENLLAQKGYEVLKNVPYSGAYTTFHYCEPRRKIYTLQLEVNRALYMNEKSLEKLDSYDKIKSDLTASILEFAKVLAENKF